MPDLISIIGGILTDMPTKGLLRERLQLAYEEAARKDRRIQQLEDKNRQLQNELSEFREQEPASLMAHKFVEHEGAFFKQKPGGGYDRAVYCPDCRRSTSSLMDSIPFHCAQCLWSANFTGRQLDAVMGRLPDAPGN